MADKKISQFTDYPTPLNADIIPVVDIANNTTKKTTWANIKATLKTYFDTLYVGKFCYVLPAYAALTSPADSTTYYFGAHPDAGLNTNVGYARVYVPKNGTIKVAQVKSAVLTTLATTENVSFYIRLNNTTDILIGTQQLTAASNFTENAALNQAVVKGNYFEIKMVCPAWATNPTNVRIQANIYIET